MKHDHEEFDVASSKAHPFFRRKQFLINPKLQLTIAVAVIASCFCSAVGLSWLVYLNIESTNAAYAAQYPEFKDALESEMADALPTLMGLAVLAALAFATPLIVVTILFTHRFTGPIYKATMFFHRVSREPDILFASEHPLTFRKNDYFKEFAEAVNSAASSLKPREGFSDSSSSETSE